MSKKMQSLPEPRPLGSRSNPNEGRCSLVIGRLGSGKTSYAVTRAVKMARRYRLPLISNAAIRPDALVLRDWQDLAALPLCQDLDLKCKNGCHERDGRGCHPAVLVLDELHLWYPSATGLMPKDQIQDAFELISYARKRGWTIFATTQAKTRVHTGYRQVMTELIRVSPFMEGFVHRASLIDSDSDQPIMNNYGFFSPRAARYDTRAEVRPLWQASRAAAAATGHAPPLASWSQQ